MEDMEQFNFEICSDDYKANISQNWSGCSVPC